jgi:hypothetical protein
VIAEPAIDEPAIDEQPVCSISHSRGKSLRFVDPALDPFQTRQLPDEPPAAGRIHLGEFGYLVVLRVLVMVLDHDL